MNRNIIRSIITIFTSKIGVLLLTIITTPLLVRLLGSNGYGDYSFLLSTLQWLLVFVYAGSFEGIRKFIAEERKQENWIDDVFAFYFKTVSLIALLVSIVIITIAPTETIVDLLGEEFYLYFYLIAVMIPFKAFFRTSRSALMGLGLEHRSEPLRIVDRLIFLGIIIGIFYLEWGIAAVLAGRTIAIGIVAFIAIGFIGYNIRLTTIFTRSSRYIPRRNLLKYGISSMVLLFTLTSLYHVDIILLRTIVGSKETGYYRAALVLAEFLWFAPIAIQTALLHSTSKLWIEGQYERLTTISTKAMRYTLLLTLLLALGMAGLSDPFISLYFGEEFDAAVIPLLLLLPGALGFAVARPIFAISQGQDNLRILLIVTLIAAGLNIMLNLILIPTFGMQGAAVATSIAYGSMCGLHVWSARRLGFDPLADLRIRSILITAIITAIPVIIIPQYISSDIIALISVPPIGFFVFLIIAFKTKSIETHEIQSLIPNKFF